MKNIKIKKGSSKVFTGKGLTPFIELEGATDSETHYDNLPLGIPVKRDLSETRPTGEDII